MNGKGAELFGYCVYGVACAEVEIDCLTGDHNVLKVDIVMDIGDSLNPAVDIGQIEGAFIQGYGNKYLKRDSKTPFQAWSQWKSCGFVQMGPD